MIQPTATEKLHRERQGPLQRLLFSRREAAAILCISVRTVDSLIHNHELLVRRIGRRILIPRSELDRFVRRDHPIRPNGAAKEVCGAGA